jgi:hypothetical protein
MILIVLAVVWVVALTPMVLRKISERQLTSGVRAYHRRLSSSGYSSGSTDRVNRSVPGAMIGFSAAALRLHEERYGVTPTDSPTTQPERAAYEDVLPTAPTATASPATAARRRQVVSVLAGATVLFLLVGIIPGARVLWDLALLTLAFTAAYVALLIHFHRLAVERAQKVIAIETRRHASEALENRRHVMTVGARYASGTGRTAGAARFASDGYRGSDLASAASSYARSVGALSGSGWSVTSGGS